MAQACRPPCQEGFSQRVFVHQTGWGASLREGHMVGGVQPPGALGSRRQAPGSQGRGAAWRAVSPVAWPRPCRGIVTARGPGGRAAEVASVCAGGRPGETNSPGRQHARLHGTGLRGGLSLDFSAGKSRDQRPAGQSRPRRSLPSASALPPGLRQGPSETPGAGTRGRRRPRLHSSAPAPRLPPAGCGACLSYSVLLCFN